MHEEFKAFQRTSDRISKQLLLASFFTLLAVCGLLFALVPSCSVQPKAGCEGSPVGATRNLQCPDEAPLTSTHQITEICAQDGTWKEALNTCTSTCFQTLFKDIQPLLASNCEGCHTGVSGYQRALSWSAEIARRVGLPTSNPAHMPQGTSPQLSGEEIARIQRWFNDGALQTCPETGDTPKFLDLNYIETVMVQDMNAIDPSDRPFTRYLISAHIVDSQLLGEGDGDGDGDEEDALANAATGELNTIFQHAIDKGLNGVNDLTQDVFQAQPVDAARSVWRIDLRSYAIGAAEIAAIEAADTNINIVSQTTRGTLLQTLSGTKKPWFHADNFLDLILRNSSVYYTLVNAPGTTAQLQQQLGVDFNGQLANGTALFVGSANSPIAEQKNRLLVRAVQARSQNAFYWQTFDVDNKPAVPVNTKLLFQFPLINGTGGKALYTSDASEVIYSLPNGFIGFYLTDGAGNRVNSADIAVVRDTLSPISPIINNANSCSRCHSGGLIPMLDQVKNAVNANAAQFDAEDVRLVNTFYRGPVATASTFLTDNKQYASALTKIGVDPGVNDPLSVVSDQFLLNWDLKHAATFLFLTPEQMKEAINVSPTARVQIGALLTPGGTVSVAQFSAVLQQLIKDAHLFQDP